MVSGDPPRACTLTLPPLLLARQLCAPVAQPSRSATMAGADVVTIPSGPDSYLKSNEVRSAALLPPSCQRGHTLPLDVFITTRAAGANAAETACFIACQGRLEIRQGLGLGASAGREVTPAKRTEVASCCSCFVAALRAAGSIGVVAAAGIFGLHLDRL